MKYDITILKMITDNNLITRLDLLFMVIFLVPREMCGLNASIIISNICIVVPVVHVFV